MRERPILMSAPMVRATFEDRKTKTRRVLNPQPDFLQIYEHKGKVVHDSSLRSWCWNGKAHGRYPDEWGPSLAAMCPYGVPGDRLWVRETCQAVERPCGDDGVFYPADEGWRPIENTPEAAARWLALLHYGKSGKRALSGPLVPSIHMPRWACRLVLELTEVRVERLQDITEADARAEGVIKYEPMESGGPAEFSATHGGELRDNARSAFRDLWDSINGDRPGCTWDDNCWVWVLGFKRVQP